MKKIVFALITVCVLLSGCQGKKEDNKVVIGAILPLSGSSAAVLGEPKKQGLELAAKYYTEKGYDLKVVFEDSEGISKKGISALNKLVIEGNIDYYYIDMTPIIYSCMPIINNKQIRIKNIFNLRFYSFILFTGEFV